MASVGASGTHALQTLLDAIERPALLVRDPDRSLIVAANEAAGRVAGTTSAALVGHAVDTLADIVRWDERALGLADSQHGHQLFVLTATPPQPTDNGLHVDMGSGPAFESGAEHELRAVLEGIVESARDVLQTRFAALGVLGENEELREFITAGVSQAERARSGHPPVGRGLLGVLLRLGQTLNVDNIAADPRSAGFPPGHPPMKSMIGVPISLRDRIYGNLYVADKRDGSRFADRDVTTLAVLAEHAATAIDRALIHQSLALEHRRLLAVIDRVPAGVLLTDLEGQPVLANAAARSLLGAPPGSTVPVYGRDYVLLDSDDEPLSAEDRPLFAAATTGESLDNLPLTVEAGGHRVPILASVAPVGDGDVISGAVAAFQDVTRIREAERLKDNFLSLVTHELRTPLTTIEGGARLLSGMFDRLDASTRQQLIDDIVDDASQLSHMLHNVLLVTEIEAGHRRFVGEPTSIPASVQEAVDEVAGRFPEARFTVDVAPELPAAWAETGLLVAALRNVVENAAKFGGEADVIRVSGYAARGHVYVEVQDSGPGIAPGEESEIFERFSRGRRQSRGRGLGLGLYLTRHIVGVLGGRIWVHSPSGGGACFVIELPVAAPDR